MVNAVDGYDFSPESRFTLFGLRLLFLVRLDDGLRRTFWRGLHARRGLTLWACGRSAARLSVDRAGPALRLQLTLRLGSNRAAGAGLGFVRVFVLRQGLRPCHPGRGDKADGDKRDAHGCSPLCLTTKPIYASHSLSHSALILINQPTSRCNPFRCVPAAALECLIIAVACTRFRRHRVRCFNGTGGASWSGGSLHGSSSLRLFG